MPHLAAPEKTQGEIYSRAFWLVFVANLFLCIANTLTYRFAEFVTFLGGSEEQTGSIVAAALAASIAARAVLGQALDRFGTRNVWLCSTLFYLAGGALLYVADDTGWQLYVARATFAIGLACMYAAALSYVQGLAPAHRRTEIIATYGASGFIGMIFGAQLGDWLFQVYPNGTGLYHMLFGLSMAMGVVHGVMPIFVLRDERHVRPDCTPAMHKLLLRYWPGPMLLVTGLMGLSLAVTTIFLTRYSTERGISGVRVFFSSYAITAFLMRLAARNWSQYAGRHRLIALALLSHAVAILALLPVQSGWHFIPSGFCFGFGHALLFPCVVSLGAGAFPEQFRGTGTTITLSAIDLGTILSAPALGWMIDHFGFQILFHVLAVILAVGGGAYGIISWKTVDSDMVPRRAPSLPMPESLRVATKSVISEPLVLKAPGGLASVRPEAAPGGVAIRA